MKHRVLDTKPDPFDGRDYKYRDLRPKQVTVAQVHDLVCPPVKDQGQTGGCVFNWLATAMEQSEIEWNHENWWIFEPNFLYYVYREAMGEVNEDSGAWPRVALKTAARAGICRESLHPRSLGMWARPSAFAREEALNHRPLSYWALEGLEDMFISIGYDQCGFGAALTLYESWSLAESNGMVRMPEPGEKMEGTHMVFLHGYDMHKGWFKGQNSWGKDWGYDGHFFLPFEYLMKHGSDFWTIRRISVVTDKSTGSRILLRSPAKG